MDSACCSGICAMRSSWALMSSWLPNVARVPVWAWLCNGFCCAGLGLCCAVGLGNVFPGKLGPKPEASARVGCGLTCGAGSDIVIGAGSC